MPMWGDGSVTRIAVFDTDAVVGCQHTTRIRSGHVTFDASVTQITQGVVDGGKNGSWE
ncbi:MAG: hypothetical protein U0587_09625 [Candidatus Binatia bacterium]